MTRPRKNPGASRIRTRDLPLSNPDALPLGQGGGALDCTLRCAGELFIGWLTSHQHTGISQRRICSNTKSYVSPHWNRSWGSNVLSHPVTKYCHRANQSRLWHPTPGEWQGSLWIYPLFSGWYCPTWWTTPDISGDRPQGSLSRGGRLTTTPPRWPSG